MNANTNTAQEIYDLVKYALKKAGLHNADILQCKKLSSAVLKKTGRNISAVTLFRMANPHKYKVRHYPQTLQILLDYCELHNFDELPKIIKPPRPLVFLKQNTQDEAEPLDSLISSILESENKKIIFDFLENIPEKYNAVTDKLVTLNHGFAKYFRSQRHTMKAVQMFKELNAHPNFQTNFTMTFPDMDYVNGYFYDGLEAYLKECNVEKTLSFASGKRSLQATNAMEKCIFHYTLYIWMAYVKNNFAGVKQMGDLFFAKEKGKPAWLHTLSDFPILKGRYYCARILYYHVTGNLSKRQESLLQLSGYLHSIIHIPAHLHESIFIITMACDALLLTGQSLDCMGEFLRVKTLCDYAASEMEPVQTRFLMYGKKYKENPDTEPKVEKPYIYGYYELNFSHQMQSIFHRTNQDLI